MPGSASSELGAGMGSAFPAASQDDVVPFGFSAGFGTGSPAGLGSLPIVLVGATRFSCKVFLASLADALDHEAYFSRLISYITPPQLGGI